MIDKILRFYDKSKQGIIVVGNPRCGSHLLTSIITKYYSEFTDVLYVDEIQNNEYHNEESTLSSKWFTDQMMIPKKYTVTSAVSLPMVSALFNQLSIYEIIKHKFTTIKLLRSPMDQFMSTIIKEMVVEKTGRSNWHYSLTPETFNDLVTYPVSISKLRVDIFVRNLQYLASFPVDHIINYDEIANLPSSKFVKNNYGIPPEKFFKNYTYISQKFSDIVLH